MAQVMRYHQYPTTAVGSPYLGGDESGGPYKWSDMLLVPDCSTTLAQRKAIGALCYDAAVSVNTQYGSNASTANTLDAKTALTTTFKYGNAVKGYNGGNNIGSNELKVMVNPNLDYGHPVILGIKAPDPGHAVVCDGYGYNSSTMYHHLNMGWMETANDAWYNLPYVTTTNPNHAWTSVYKCVYNIFTLASGEIVSGRVSTPNGNPLANADVVATPVGIGWPVATNTNSRGIYVLAHLGSGPWTWTISVTKSGYFFSPRNVTTGTSSDYSPTSGNLWGIDFVGFAGDFDGDGDVDLLDFAIFSKQWRQPPGVPSADIAPEGGDGIVDFKNLAVFVESWLIGK